MSSAWKALGGSAPPLEAVAFSKLAGMDSLGPKQRASPPYGSRYVFMHRPCHAPACGAAMTTTPDGKGLAYEVLKAYPGCRDSQDLYLTARHGSSVCIARHSTSRFRCSHSILNRIPIHSTATNDYTGEQMQLELANAPRHSVT